MIKKLLKTVLPVVLCGSLGSVFYFSSSAKNKILDDVFLMPPKWVFPFAWTILYILLAISSYIYNNDTKNEKEKNQRGLLIFYFNLFFNAFWTFFFFNLGNKTFAFVWLIFMYLLSISMYLAFKKESKKSSYFLIPYLAWELFALYLNFSCIIS